MCIPTTNRFRFMGIPSLLVGLGLSSDVLKVLESSDLNKLVKPFRDGGGGLLGKKGGRNVVVR